MSSHEISADIEALQQELTNLRGRVEEDSSAFSNLELELTQVRESLARAQQTVAERESRLAERQQALREAKHLERLAAYADDLRMHKEAADEAARAGGELIAAVEAYENQTLRLRQLLEEMRAAFGTDERVSEVEAVLDREPEKLRGTWEAIVGAIRWRLDDRTEDRPVEVGKEDLSEELQDMAQSRSRTLIKEYFGEKLIGHVATISDSGAVSRDVELLEQELVDLRVSVEQDTSSFAELERQVRGLKDRLDRTAESVTSVEARLEAKRIELVEARRAEAVAAYKDHLSARDERAVRVSDRTDELLAELDAFDRDTAATREILAEMRNHRGYEVQAAEVEAKLADDPEPYRAASEKLAAVVRARFGTKLEEQLIDTAERSAPARATEDLPEQLQDEAHARRRARIKEHFNNR